MPIVQGLFGDMLPPTMQDGGGRGAVGIPQVPSRTPQAPIAKQPLPVMQQQAPVMKQPLPVMQQQQPQMQPAPTIQQQPLTNQAIDLSGLEGLDILGGGQPLDLGVAGGGQTFVSMPDYLETIPQNPTDFLNQSIEFLSSISSGNTTYKVNRRDDVYNEYFGFGESGLPTYRYEGDPADFRAEAGLSDAFAVYDRPDSQITSQSVRDAYNALNSAEDRTAFLSDYYGFDITPATNEGANYTNAAKYGTDAQRMTEFQSIVEPILQRSIPYIAATQGLNYTDALEYAYTHDPMVAALYNQYGVDLYRQTKDGSTYIYDPIAGQEIRTLEVKDAKFKDFLPSIALAVATAGAGSLIGGAIANSTALGSALGTAGSNALGSAIAGIGTAAASGARGSDLITAGVLSGLGGYAKGLNEVAQGAAAGSQAAIDAAAKADIFNNVAKVANAADAIANKNYFKLLNMGLEAGGLDSFNTLTANKLNELGGEDGTLFGLNVDQLAPAVNGFAKDVLQGKDFEDALKGGVLEYIKQGGALDQFKLKDFNFPDFDFNTPDGIKGIEDFVKDNWGKLKNSSFVQGLRQAGRDIDDSVIQPLIDPLKGLDQKLDDLIKTPDSIKAIEDGLKVLPDKLDDMVDTPDWIKNIEDWFKGLEFPDININIPSGAIAGGATGAGGGVGDFTMSSLDTGIDTVTPSELFAQKDYLAGLLD